MSKNPLSVKSIKHVKAKKEFSQHEITGMVSHYATLKNAIEQFILERNTANFGSPKYAISNQAIVQLQTKAQTFYAKHEATLTSDKALLIMHKLKGQLSIPDQQKLNEIKKANRHDSINNISKTSNFQFSLFGKFASSVTPTALTTSSRELFKENKENQSVDSNAPTPLDNSKISNQMSF